MTTNEIKTYDVIVVGGGLAGLAAGATAAQAGASVVVLEARRPGGRARTTEREGFVFNLGAHALYRGGPGMDVLQDLGVRPQGSPPPLRDYQVLADGELHTMPSGPGSLLRTTAVSVRSKVQLAKLLARLPRMEAAASAGVSVDDWIGSHELRPDGERLLQALIRIGTYGSDFERMSAEAAIRQLQHAAAKGVLYLDGGWAQLIEGLSAHVEVRRASVTSVMPAPGGGAEITTDAGTFAARSVVIAAGTPAAVLALLPAGVDTGWGDVGDPVVAACLDSGVSQVPTPGYVLALDEPVYATTQAPPARQAPPGCAVVAVLRYGVRTADSDRTQLEHYRAVAGVAEEDVVTDRFLARMVVTGAMPLARNGGLHGRPATSLPSVPGVYVAGDWVGPEGMLADAALASGRAAALAAVAHSPRTASSATLVS